MSNYLPSEKIAVYKVDDLLSFCFTLPDSSYSYLVTKTRANLMVFKELIRLTKGDRLPTNPQAKSEPRRIRRAKSKNIGGNLKKKMI